MKKILTIFMIGLLSVGMFGCSTDDTKKNNEPVIDVEGSMAIPYSDFLTEMNMDKMVEKIKNKESFKVVFIGTKCEWCEKQKGALKAYTEETKEEIFYIDLWTDTTLKIREEKATDGTITQYIENLNDMQFEGTPTMLIYEKGELKDKHVGYMPEYSDLKTFLSK